MIKLSFFFLLLTSINVLSVEVDGSGIASSSQQCFIIDVEGTGVKSDVEGTGYKAVQVCVDKILKYKK